MLKCCRNILTSTNDVSSITLELSTIIVELVATFSAQLTIKHVIDIIEMCHQQIREYVLNGNSRVTSTSTSLLPSKTNSLLNNLGHQVNLVGLSTRISIDDKVLSAIYLTGGQVCHYYTKHRIISSGGGLHSSSLSSESGTNNCINTQFNITSTKVSQDCVHLLLYLSKKLESKLSFYHDLKSSSSDSSSFEKSKDKNKNEIFVLIKIYNCFYLKCLQYTLLTIPDAWKYMTNHLMEIVW